MNKISDGKIRVSFMKVQRDIKKIVMCMNEILTRMRPLEKYGLSRKHEETINKHRSCVVNIANLNREAMNELITRMNQIINILKEKNIGEEIKYLKKVPSLRMKKGTKTKKEGIDLEIY